MSTIESNLTSIILDKQKMQQDLNLKFPNELDVKLFEDFLDLPNSNITSQTENINVVHSVQQVSAISSVVKPSYPDLLKIILNKIQDVQNKHSNNTSHIKKLMEGLVSDNFSAGDLLRMQLEIAQFTLSLELTSKITNKVPQSIETLMRG